MVPISKVFETVELQRGGPQMVFRIFMEHADPRQERQGMLIAGKLYVVTEEPGVHVI